MMTFPVKIEKVAPSKRKQGRWLIWLEDGSLLRVSQNEMADFALHKDMELDEETYEVLTHTAQLSAMKSKALNVLSTRSCSKGELIEKLAAKPRRSQKTPGERLSYDEEREQRERRRALAEEIANQMEELGLINEGEYAKRIVEHYAAKGCGVRKIRDELFRRRVPRELWDDALEEMPDSSDAIDELLEKRLRSWDGERKELKRASDWLARRGFSWPEISEAIQRFRDRYGDSIEDHW